MFNWIRQKIINGYFGIGSPLANNNEMKPESEFKPHSSLIHFVNDRPGHDHRYAIDATKIERELGWRPKETFDSGLRKTVEWYLINNTWWQRVLDGNYRGQRLGLGRTA